LQSRKRRSEKEKRAISNSDRAATKREKGQRRALGDEIETFLGQSLGRRAKTRERKRVGLEIETSQESKRERERLDEMIVHH